MRSIRVNWALVSDDAEWPVGRGDRSCEAIGGRREEGWPMSSNRDAVPRGVVVRKDLAARWDDRSQQKGTREAVIPHWKYWK